MLTVQVLHVRNHLFLPKQRVQEVDEQVLVGLGSKNTLETEVGQQADISFFCYMIHTHLFFVAKLHFSPDTAKYFNPFLHSQERIFAYIIQKL